MEGDMFVAGGAFSVVGAGRGGADIMGHEESKALQ